MVGVAEPEPDRDQGLPGAGVRAGDRGAVAAEQLGVGLRITPDVQNMYDRYMDYLQKSDCDPVRRPVPAQWTSWFRVPSHAKRENCGMLGYEYTNYSLYIYRYTL